MPEPTTVAVLITCHERRETTLACLDAVAAQSGPVNLRVYVADAGSRDGTPVAVAEHPARIELLLLGPDVFWNGGMRAAWEVAHADGHAAYLWLNDDTRLDLDAVERLVRCSQRLHLRHGDVPRIIVGTTRDPIDGSPTYGGVSRLHRTRPLAFTRLDPDIEPRPAETMNGNIVLVPAAVADRVGNLDAAFTHGMGDFDYGLRARDQGCEVWVAPGTHGVCRRNPSVEPPSTPRQAWQRLRGPKGLPVAEWTRFARRHAGPLWPVFAASPYVRSLVRAAWRGTRTA